MVVPMSRYTIQTVTQPLQGLTVLVPSSNENDRWISTGTIHCAVRPITSADLERAGRLREIFRKEDLPLAVGVAEMQRSIRKRDERGFREAYENLRPWFLTVGKDTLNPRKIDWMGARFIYTEVINAQTRKAHLVMWPPEDNLLMPALYCPDLKTAKFVLLAMGRLRVCPYCKSVFEGNTDYCQPSHGVNWRTAQSRRKKSSRTR